MHINLDTKICVMGLGYVGLTLAASLASVGFNVHGVEIRDEVTEKLGRNEPHFHEPGLTDLLGDVIKRKKFTFSKTIPSNYDGSVYIITVGTPLGSGKIARLDMIRKVSEEVAKNLKGGELVILRSTVKLGVSRDLVYPILSKPGLHFELAFCPERTLEGNALKEIKQLPQIIGGFSEGASVGASQIFNFLTKTIVKVSSPETAEMIKLVDNSHRDALFAYSNEIAVACDFSGISATEVINLGKLGYERTNLPAPGPVGGPCLEKDPYILAEGLIEKGFTPKLILGARKVNEDQPRYVAQFLAQKIENSKLNGQRLKISLLGLAFKGRPETDDLRGSMAIPIRNEIKKAFENAEFWGFDAIVSHNKIEELELTCARSIEDAFLGASLVIILNNHPVFEHIPITTLGDTMNQSGFIYDFWNHFDKKKMNLTNDITYLSLGGHSIEGSLPYET